MSIRGSLLFAFMTMLTGCVTTIIPPADPAHPVTVLVTDYGRHSSLLLPDPNGQFVEYAFGDWNWYALGHKNAPNAIFALFDSPQATLGRRWVYIDSNGPNIARSLAAERVERVVVDADQAKKLRENLDREYTRHIDSVIFNADEGLYFVRCDEPYNLFRNCNHMTANWLNEMDARTEGFAIMSHFQVVDTREKQSATTK